MLLGDWISLDFPWYVQVEFVLLVAFAYAFWPLTFLMAGAIALAVRVRKRATRVILIALSVLWVFGLLAKLTPNIDAAVRQANVRSRQYTLAQSKVVAGMTLPAGTVVTRSSDDPNGVEALDLKTPATIGGLPVIGQVYLTDARVNGEAMLARDATINGIPCAAGAIARLNEIGDLAECTLAHAAVVKSVPCKDKINLENGVTCTLAREYVYRGYAWPVGTLANVNDAQNASFTVGSRAPAMTVAGLALPQGANVNFGDKGLWVDFTGLPLHYRDCDINHLSNVLTSYRSFEAQCVGTQGRTLTLPPSVIGGKQIRQE